MYATVRAAANSAALAYVQGDEDDIPADAEKALHDYEEPCEESFCNVVTAAYNGKVCPPAPTTAPTAATVTLAPVAAPCTNSPTAKATVDDHDDHGGASPPHCISHVSTHYNGPVPPARHRPNRNTHLVHRCNQRATWFWTSSWASPSWCVHAARIACLVTF